jgi:hypothetical protein
MLEVPALAVRLIMDENSMIDPCKIGTLATKEEQTPLGVSWDAMRPPRRLQRLRCVP